MRGFLIRASVAGVVCVTMGAACSAKKEPPPGQIMLVVQTDMSLPKDVDSIRIEVKSSGRMQHADNYAVGAGFLLMPATLGIVAGENAAQPVTIRIQARRNGKLKTLREATTTVPGDRVATLRMPIQWLCTGKDKDLGGDEAESGCGAGQTCVAGSCKDWNIDPTKLPTYAPEDVFGGGQGPQSGGKCFDTLKCFQGTTVYAKNQIDLASCTISLGGGGAGGAGGAGGSGGKECLPDGANCDGPIPCCSPSAVCSAGKCTVFGADAGGPSPGGAGGGGGAAQQPQAEAPAGQPMLNVAVQFPAGGDGICEPGQGRCFVPLDLDPDLGWTLDASGGNPAAGTIRLPRGVCDKLGANAQAQVAVAKACAAKTASLPTCGPWSATGGEGQPTGDAGSNECGDNASVGAKCDALAAHIAQSIPGGCPGKPLDASGWAQQCKAYASNTPAACACLASAVFDCALKAPWKCTSWDGGPSDSGFGGVLPVGCDAELNALFTASGCTGQCSAGKVSCAGSCVDTQTDKSNCGTCGNTCPSGQVCAAGKCAQDVPDGGGAGPCAATPQCAHSPCSTGEALNPACDKCVTMVCETGPACCNGAWGSGCVTAYELSCGCSCGGK